MAKGADFGWYKHYPARFLRGVRGMAPDVIGAYIVILDLIYADEGSCPNDAHWLGGQMGCNGRKAAGLVQVLIKAGKLQLDSAGRLTNERASEILNIRESVSRHARDNGSTGGRRSGEVRRARSKDKGLAEANAKLLDKTRLEKKEDATPNGAAVLPGFLFPAWWPSEAWESFVTMRKKIRAPLTDRATELAVAQLMKMRADGHDPKAVIEQSVLRGWRGLFEVKAGGSTNGRQAAAENPEDVTLGGWLSRLRLFEGLVPGQPKGSWLAKFGPAPGSPGCLVPEEARAAFARERGRQEAQRAN